MIALEVTCRRQRCGMVILYGILTFCYVFPFFNFMSKRVRNRVQTPHFEWRKRTHLPFGVLKNKEECVRQIPNRIDWVPVVGANAAWT